jgi:hypothetical protein
MKVIGKREREIRSWQEWERPVSPGHWVEGRSAMEIARAFFRHDEPRLPEALTTLLRCNPSLAKFVADEAHPELRTPLPPSGSSGPRNHDVWLRGHSGERAVCVGIEAKADEAFGPRLATKRASALADSNKGKATRWLERLEILGSMLFGPRFDPGDPVYSAIGYQLLSGVAGTAIQAAQDGANIAVFVVYEFATTRTKVKNHARNTAALDEFVRLLPGRHGGPAPGSLVGPFELDNVELYIGKVGETV